MNPPTDYFQYLKTVCGLETRSVSAGKTARRPGGSPTRVSGASRLFALRKIPLELKSFFKLIPGSQRFEPGDLKCWNFSSAVVLGQSKSAAEKNQETKQRRNSSRELLAFHEQID
jgi:hypothetical protein